VAVWCVVAHMTSLLQLNSSLPAQQHRGAVAYARLERQVSMPKTVAEVGCFIRLLAELLLLRVVQQQTSRQW
jgi:hypothetical protein